MNKVLLTTSLLVSLVSSALADNVWININPSVGYFKKSFGTGIELGANNKNFTIRTVVLSGNLEERSIELKSKYYLFAKYAYLNNSRDVKNFKKEENLYIGIYYNINLTSEDFSVPRFNNIFNSFFILKGAKGVKKSYYIGAEYDFQHKLMENLIGYLKFNTDRYFDSGTYFSVGTGIAFSF